MFDQIIDQILSLFGLYPWKSLTVVRPGVPSPVVAETEDYIKIKSLWPFYAVMSCLIALLFYYGRQPTTHAYALAMGKLMPSPTPRPTLTPTPTPTSPPAT